MTQLFKGESLVYRPHRRTYTVLPAAVRLQKWFRRTEESSRRFKRPRDFFLPRRLAEALQISDCAVQLDEHGQLLSGGRVIAHLNGQV